MEEKLYLVVDKDNREWAFENEKPIKTQNNWLPELDEDKFEPRFIELPKGTIKKLIGIELNFDSEPYEWNGNNSALGEHNCVIDLEELNIIRFSLMFAKQVLSNYKTIWPEKYNKLSNTCDKLISDLEVK